MKTTMKNHLRSSGLRLCLGALLASGAIAAACSQTSPQSTVPSPPPLAEESTHAQVETAQVDPYARGDAGVGRVTMDGGTVGNGRDGGMGGSGDAGTRPHSTEPTNPANPNGTANPPNPSPPGTQPGTPPSPGSPNTSPTPNPTPAPTPPSPSPTPNPPAPTTPH